MKNILFFLTIFVVITITACSASKTDSSVVETEPIIPVEEMSFFDKCYTMSEYKIDFSNDTQYDRIEFEHDLSQIETADVKQLIIKLSNEYNYTSFTLKDIVYSNMEWVEVTYYIVVLDNDYWLITSNGNRAYASKDELGILSGENDYLIDETETPYR